MSINFPVPEMRVLAIASHVTYGYVGNTMATFVMQALGCEVAAINTVNFSNHTGYRQFTGTRTPASVLTDLYTGLQDSQLTDFDMLLSGYTPSADSVAAVGRIARDLRSKAALHKPGSFFWVLDPVMGDNGRLYVSEDVVPEYKSVLKDADLLLPNQFEIEVLSGVKIENFRTLRNAVAALHKEAGVRHVVVTSVRLETHKERLSVVGSTSKADGSPRLFRVDVPVLDCFFSGTGDMFAALMVVRLKEACIEAGLLETKSWVGGDEVHATELPLAKATEKVLSSMQTVLSKTMQARNKELEMFKTEPIDEAIVGKGKGKRKHLAETKAAEIRLVRNVRDLLEPDVKYRAQELEV